MNYLLKCKCKPQTLTDENKPSALENATSAETTYPREYVVPTNLKQTYTNASNTPNTPSDVEKGDWCMVDLTESADTSIRNTYDGVVTLKHLIGYGSYGRVYRANIHHDGCNSTIAVKVMIYDAKNTKKILQEINVMTQLHHKNIVCAIRHMSWKRIPNEEEEDLNAIKNMHQTWIVQEYCDGGNLADAVKSGRLSQTNTERDFRLMLYLLLDVAHAMAYMHKHNVIHGDLKCANIMLNTGGPALYHRFVAKVGDFGLSHILLNHVTHVYTANMGTITHMSHEMLRSGQMSRASDVYAFGMVMFEVLTGKKPYDGLMQGAVVEQVLVSNKQPVFPEYTPQNFIDLIKECWHSKPEKRPTFDSLIVSIESIKQSLKHHHEES